MKKRFALMLFTSVFIFFCAACQQQTDDEPPAEPAQPDQQPQDRAPETIDESNQKVNDSSDLKQKETTKDCPAPRDSDEMCAQVIVWALSPDGHCCEYPTPCHAPKDWKTFHTEDECRDAASE